MGGYGSIISLILGTIALIVVAILILQPISDRQVDGEFKEGWIYGKFEGYEIQEPVCCSYYGSTEIKLEGHGWKWFHYNCEYIMEDNLENGTIYGFYYTSSEVQWAITRDFGEPTGRWLPYIEKIVDCENTVLWESHYGELPQVCWTIIFVVAVVLISPLVVYYVCKRRKK